MEELDVVIYNMLFQYLNYQDFVQLSRVSKTIHEKLSRCSAAYLQTQDPVFLRAFSDCPASLLSTLPDLSLLVIGFFSKDSYMDSIVEALQRVGISCQSLRIHSSGYGDDAPVDEQQLEELLAASSVVLFSTNGFLQRADLDLVGDRLASFVEDCGGAVVVTGFANANTNEGLWGRWKSSALHPQVQQGQSSAAGFGENLQICPGADQRLVSLCGPHVHRLSNARYYSRGGAAAGACVHVCSAEEPHLPFICSLRRVVSLNVFPAETKVAGDGGWEMVDGEITWERVIAACCMYASLLGEKKVK